LVSRQCAIGPEKESDEIDGDIQPDTTGRSRRHRLLNVRNQSAGGAGAPGADEILSCQLWRFIAAGEIRKMAVCAVGLVRRTALLGLRDSVWAGGRGRLSCGGAASQDDGQRLDS